MKIKKGDMVKMRSGKDRAKTGKVLRALPGSLKVVVEGLNMLTKHQRPQKEGATGQKIQFPRAVPVSTVFLICTKCQKSVRVGVKILENGTRARMCKQCKELIS